MQSIIKNAFDKVSVIKDAVGSSIEEAVKNNARDASYVFNSGSSISTSIVNWAEKNIVSEKANHFKTSASIFVGDLAIGLKGMTNNITVQNNFDQEKIYKQNKPNQSTNEYDYFSGEFDSIDNIEAFYNDTNSSPQVVNVSENTSGEIHCKESTIENEMNTPQNIPICDLYLNNNSDEERTKFEELDMKPNYSSCNVIVDNSTENEVVFMNNAEPNAECNLIDLDNVCSQNVDGKLACLSDDRKTDHEKKINCTNANSPTSENLIEISNTKCEFLDNNITQRYDNLKNDNGLNNFINSSHKEQEACIEVNSDTKNHEISKSEEYSKNNSQLNPLTVFQQISKLEAQNIFLEGELEKVKNESVELKEKISMKTKVINSVNSRLSKLELEKKSMSIYIKELESQKSGYKLKIDELEQLNLDLKLNEDASREQLNMIKSLQEKILELENTLAIGEANRTESLKVYQNEVSELRLKLSDSKIKEGNDYKPYINRISTLEHQLSELRVRHSSELKKFEIMIDNLKKKSAKDRNEIKILEDKLQDANKTRLDIIEKYDLQISQYKLIVDRIENNKSITANATNRITNSNKELKFSICNNVNELTIENRIVDSGKLILNQQIALPYLSSPTLSKSNYTNQQSIMNPLQEEIKQALHDKQLLENEYFTVYEKNKQIERELIEEKQRNKLLQQQLDSMFKLVNDLNVKLNESKKS